MGIESITKPFEALKEKFNKQVRNFAKNVPGFGKALNIPLFSSMVAKIDDIRQCE